MAGKSITSIIILLIPINLSFLYFLMGQKNECVKKVKIGYKMVQKLIICGKKSLFSLIIFALLKYLLSLYSLMRHQDSFPVVINSKLNPLCSL